MASWSALVGQRVGDAVAPDVEILRDGLLVGTGRWNGRRIEDCPIRLRTPESPEDEEEADAEAEALFAQVEEAIASEEEAILANAPDTHNEDGVDLRVIDWMLSFTPRERLKIMEGFAGAPFRPALEVLTNHDVEFIVIGGVAANLQGASFTTSDLDIVYSRRPQNIQRLLLALQELDATFNDFAGRRIFPNESYLVTPRPKLLKTKFCLLDRLGTLSMEEDATGYEDLLPHTISMDLAGLTLTILSLEKVIEAKTKANRLKDNAVLPLLRAALERSKQR